MVFTRPKEIIIGFAAQYTVMPLIALGLSVPPSSANGYRICVILVGWLPWEVVTSNVITYIAGGDVALSVGMTITSNSGSTRL